MQKQKKKLASNTHDWYCWDCHKAGEVIACDHCPRVFHKKCAHSGTVANGKWKCPSCQVNMETIPMQDFYLATYAVVKKPRRGYFVFVEYAEVKKVAWSGVLVIEISYLHLCKGRVLWPTKCCFFFVSFIF